MIIFSGSQLTPLTVDRRSTVLPFSCRETLRAIAAESRWCFLADGRCTHIISSLWVCSMKALWAFNVGFGRTCWVTEWRVGFTSPLGAVSVVPLTASSWETGHCKDKWHETANPPPADVTRRVSPFFLSWSCSSVSFFSSLRQLWLLFFFFFFLCAFLIPSELFNRGVGRRRRRASALWWDSSMRLCLPLQRAKTGVSCKFDDSLRCCCRRLGSEKSEK